MTAPSKKQTRVLWFALTGLAIATVIALIVAAVWGLGRVLDLLSPVLWPLAIAAVAACLLSPVVDWLEKRKVPRTRAIVLVFIVALALILGVLASVIPQVVVELQQLVAKIPEYSARLQARISEFMAQPPEFLRRFTTTPNDPSQQSDTAASVVSKVNHLVEILPVLATWIFTQFGKVASGFGLLAGLALIPVYAFYFLLEKRSIEGRWRDYLPVRDSSAKDEMVFVLEAISQYLVTFFRGQVLVAICDAVLYTIGFLSIGLNYAFLLGFAAVFLTMIPFLGAIVICLTALILAFVQYGDWSHPLMVLVVFGIVQALEGLVISPKIMGNRMALHPLVIIIAVMTGTTLFGGILGGILAIPLAAVLRVVLMRYVWKHQPPGKAP
jgi:predicted PurR-regulated permease PerM